MLTYYSLSNNILIRIFSKEKGNSRHTYLTIVCYIVSVKILFCSIIRIVKRESVKPEVKKKNYGLKKFYF